MPYKYLVMKKKIFFCIILITVSFLSIAQQKTLILAHPTQSNLELFTYLIDNNIIQIEGINIAGIYHQKEVYDYSKSKSFLENNEYPYIELEEIKEEISVDNLFQKNECTNKFMELFNHSIGIIFFGGPDIPPSIYNKQTNLLTIISDPYRHFFEASFLFHLLGSSQNPDFIPFLEQNPKYPIYGICLGMQTMNVATGGTMIQDIPSELYNLKYVEEVLNFDKNKQHRNYNKSLYTDSMLFSGNFHKIIINNTEPLTGSYDKNLHPLVYSIHHQALDRLGKGLKVLATSADKKIIEAIAHKKYPNVLGVQFHPERIFLYDSTIKFRKRPSSELESGKKILHDNNSYEFHLKYWEAFSEKINAVE